MPYAASREAFSEFEPERGPSFSAKVAALPTLGVKPGTVVETPHLPATGSAVPPGLTGQTPVPAAQVPLPASNGPQAVAPATLSAAPSPAVPSSSAPSSSAPSSSAQVAALPGRALAPGELPAWKKNAAAVSLAAGVPVIGIVIDDLGIDRRRTARAMRLPAPVTLAFLPYARHLAEQAGRARAGGHEILVHVPMEPEGAGADPGPNPLLAGLPAAELRVRLDWMLTRFPGYVGINNHMGSKFTSDTGAMDVIAAELKARGLLFLDSRTAKGAIAYERARAAGVPAAVRQVFLDRDPARKAIDAELARLEALARKQGHAIAIGHPHDATLDALEAWLPTLAAKGLQLAPVSALVR